MRHASKHQSLQLLKSLEMNDLDQNRRAFEWEDGILFNSRIPAWEPYFLDSSWCWDYQQFLCHRGSFKKKCTKFPGMQFWLPISISTFDFPAMLALSLSPAKDSFVSLMCEVGFTLRSLNFAYEYFDLTGPVSEYILIEHIGFRKGYLWTAGSWVSKKVLVLQMSHPWGRGKAFLTGRETLARSLAQLDESLWLPFFKGIL